MSVFEKVENLIKKLSENLQEREEAIKLSMLALLSGESIFLLGPPGVAKSLMARKIKEAVLDAKEFEYLMNRFSTPEEIFGPISLAKLEEDKYERKINEYLPDSEIVFLDEIWKASPSIQNTLLTVINERIFKNGTNTLKVPLRLLIAASNELPAEGEGLEALYDRFLIRLFVNNVSDKNKFRLLIDNINHKEVTISNKEKLTVDDFEEVKKNSNKIKLDDNSFHFITQLKEKLVSELKDSAPYVSDRRWKKIIIIIKTSAYVSGRDEIALGDLLLVQNLIWETPDQYEKIRKIVLDCWINTATLSTGFTIDDAKSSLDQIQYKFDDAYSQKIVPYKLIRDTETGMNYNIYEENTSEYQYWAFPNTRNSGYQYVYAWTKSKKNDFRINNADHKKQEYNLPEFNKEEIEWVRLKFKRYYVEELQIDIEKMALVEKELTSSSKILSQLSDKKDGIVENMKSVKNLLVDSYEYNISCFDSQMDETITEYSKRRDDLLYKIKSSIIENKKDQKNDKKA